MKVHYSDVLPARYFVIADGIYELSTDDLNLVIRIIKKRPIDEIQLLDIHEKKWIEVEKLLNK